MRLSLLTAATTAACAIASGDWLLTPLSAATPATVAPWTQGSLAGVVLSNGLISRTFVTSASGTPTWATLDMQTMLDEPSGESILRALSPEAILSCAGCASSRALPVPPAAFQLIGNNSAAVSGDCTFVAQGDATNLTTCQASCWLSSACTTVNYAPGGAAQGDCVLRACANPLQPALSPYAGFQVYSTMMTAASNSTPIGGLVAGPSLGRNVNLQAYFNRTGTYDAGALLPTPASQFAYTGYTTGPIQPNFAWTPGSRGADPSIPWPPPGLRLTASFTGSPSGPWAGVAAAIIYEMYQGLPLMSKWLELSYATNSSGNGNGDGNGNASSPVVLDAVVVESIALNQPFSPLATAVYAGQAEDVATGIPIYPGASKLTLLSDVQYGVHVNVSNDVLTYGGAAGSTQPRATAGDDAGLATPIPTPAAPAAPWRSMRLFFLFHDNGPEQGAAVSLYPTSETYHGCTLGPCVPGSGTPLEGAFTERRGLALRRFQLALAPQVAECPLQYHLVASDSASVRAACDQMAAVGWQMLVQSYGSGADVESQNPTYIAQVKGDVAYCKAEGVEVGMYDLVGWTRDPGRGWSALNPSGGDEGNACFASGWNEYLTQQVLWFGNATGLSMLESDGPYAGYSCSNTSHNHGASNSIQLQSRGQAAMYTALRNAGWHINAPDSWFAAGINKMGIGYNEGTSRLPRREETTIIRQVLHDATYYTNPTAAWSFLPLTGCGDPSCQFEPLADNLGDFEVSLASHLFYGVSAFLYQGTQLWDGPASKAVLVQYAALFKAFSPLLASGDLIHVTRPDGAGLDAVLHAKAGAAVPGIFAIFNPRDEDAVNASLTLPCYYTGLTGSVSVQWQPWPAATAAFLQAPPADPRPLLQPAARVDVLPLDWRSRAVLTNVSIPARSVTWGILTAGQ